MLDIFKFSLNDCGFKKIMGIVTCDVVIICIVKKYILIKSNHENM